MSRVVELGDTKKDFVSFEMRPSNYFTTAYTISYIRHGTGIPIEVRVNFDLEYYTIIIKSKEKIKSYIPFSEDFFGNIIQSKTVPLKDLKYVKKELKNLSTSTHR